MRRFRFLAAAPLLATAVACSTGAADPRTRDDDDEDVRRSASAIINGTLDTSHPAVVAILLQQGQQGGICSGTIVKTDPQRRIGWVVTAAHCVDVPPVLVVQGENFLSEDALRYEVIDYKADTRYTGQVSSSYDFAVVRIAGVDATTPTIGLVSSPDGLRSGMSVTSVGYGRTSLLSASPSSEQNTERRVVTKTLSQVGQTQIGYDMSDRGICQGDSGGPVLVRTSAGERVAGVHSYVQGDCDGFGVSGRASAGLSFFNAEMQKALPAEDCELCDKIASSGNGECAKLTRACLSDKECRGYYECRASGKGEATCLKLFPKAEGPFGAVAGCSCTRACKDKCGSTLRCKTTPKCGYELPAGACTTCTEGSCCAETLDCAADGTCYLCLKNGDRDEACASNAARKKLATCVSSSCKTECEGSGLDTGADEVADETAAEGAAPGATTITKTEGICAASAVGASPAGAASYAALAFGLAIARRVRRRRHER